MLAHAKPESIFHLPASHRAGAKQGRTESAVTSGPGPSRFTRCRASAPQPAKIRTFDFDEIFRTHQRSVYSKCFRILRNHGEAEDVVQEVFLRLLRKADTFRGEAKFSTWLHRLTINTVLMRLRKLRRQELRTARFDEAGEEEGNLGGHSAAAPWLASAAMTADQVGLRLAISQLPEGYQNVFSLHDLEGYTHEEIARLLSISVGTSKSQLHRARLRLRVLLRFGLREDSAGAFPPKLPIAPPQQEFGQNLAQ